MRKNIMPMNEQGMRGQTHLASSRIKDLIERGASAEADTHKDYRQKIQHCKACYYCAPAVAGQAITYQPCMCCGADQIYGSNRTDALCLECAKREELCKRCGADIELRIDRDEWPEPLFNQESQP